MASPVGQRKLFSFGLFEADPASGELLKEGRAVRLQDQPFRMLMLLLERPGEVITREELREKLWAENTFVEFDNGLNVAIKKIRDALGDSADNPRFVETLPRRGYRFIAPVSIKAAVAPAPLLAEAPLATEPPPALTTSIPKQSFRLRYYITGGVLAAVVLAAFVANRLWHLRKTPELAPPQPAAVELAPRRSVALLEFRNVAGRPENAWLSTAIPEMLSTELAAGEKLRLIPGEDVARMKRELHLEGAGSLDRHSAIRAGKNLGADVLLVGSYTTLGDHPNLRLRLDLRLQDASNGEILTQVAQLGQESNLFELVSAAGARVRQRLGVPEVSPVEEASVRASLPKSREAARLYAEGIARLRVMDAVSARDLLAQAIAAEAKFPLSHMAMGSAWKLLGYDQKAKAEIRRALDLSSGLPRAERLRIEGRLHQWSGEMDQAIATYRALFTLFPDNLEDGLLLAEAQGSADRVTDAMATLDHLRRLPEPFANDPRIDMAESGLHKDFDGYLAQARRAIEKARAHGAPLLEAKAQTQECNGLQAIGKPEEAVPLCEAALRMFSQLGSPQYSAVALRFLGDIRLHEGRLDEALQFYQQALAMNQKCGDDRGTAVSANEMAMVYESRGDLRHAAELYRQAYDLFLKVGHRHNAAVLAGNLGGTLLSQGKLSQSEEFLQQSLSLSREVGDNDAAATAYHPLSELELVRGNLESAQRYCELSLRLTQERGNKFEYIDVVARLAAILNARGDLAAARVKAEEALKLAGQIGAKQQLAQSKLLLAELDLEAGHALAVESTLREVIDTFVAEKMPQYELEADVALSESLVLQGKLADAQAAIAQARKIVEKDQYPKDRFLFAIAESRFNAAEARERKSATLLKQARVEAMKTIHTAHQLGFLLLEYEARLALAEAETSMNRAIGQTSLASLEKSARNHEFELVARRAAALRNH